MSISISQLLAQLADETADDVQFRSDYSGRGMYGRTCVGIVGSNSSCNLLISEAITNLTDQLFHAVQEADESKLDQLVQLNDDTQDAQRQLLNFSVDSMGHDKIYYWPKVTHEQ